MQHSTNIHWFPLYLQKKKIIFQKCKASLLLPLYILTTVKDTCLLKMPYSEQPLLFHIFPCSNKSTFKTFDLFTRGPIKYALP